MEIDLFTSILDDMDIWCGVSDDVDTWQSNSGHPISNDSMVDACKNAFDTDKVNLNAGIIW